MNNKPSFGKTYFGEICFVCTALLTLIVSYVAYRSHLLNNDAIPPIGMLILLAAAYIFGRNKSNKPRDLMFFMSIGFSALLLIVAIKATDSRATDPFTVQSLVEFIVFILLDYIIFYLVAHSDKSDDKEYKTSIAERQYKHYSESEPQPQAPPKPQKRIERLPEDEEHQLFYDLDKFREYIKLYPLSYKTEFKMLDHPRALSLLEEYCAVRQLTMAGEFRMFELHNSEELVRVYIAHQRFASNYAEAKMLDLPSNVELVEAYCSKYSLSNVAQCHIFDLDNAEQIFSAFAEDNCLCAEAVDKILTLPPATASKLIKIHLENDGSLTTNQQVKLFDLPDYVILITPFIEEGDICEEAMDKIFTLPPAIASKLIRIHIDCSHELSSQQEIAMLDLPDAKELLTLYLENFDIYDTTLDKIFTLPNAINLIRIYLDHDGELDSDQQVKLLDFPEAEDLIAQLLESDDLDEEFVDKILTLPPATANRLIRIYLENDGSLSEEQQAKLFDLPNVGDLITEFAEDGFSEVVVDKIFTLPNPATWLKVHLENGGDLNNDQQEKLLNLPEAIELAKIFLEHSCYYFGERAEKSIVNSPNLAPLLEYMVDNILLKESTQMELFNQPNARDLIIRYNKEGDLCEEATALAQAKEWL